MFTVAVLFDIIVHVTSLFNKEFNPTSISSGNSFNFFVQFKSEHTS